MTVDTDEKTLRYSDNELRADSTVVATFEYDALGQRIEKVDAIAGATTRYHYDDQYLTCLLASK